MKNNKGFTLVELLASIVILGILMWYAIPQITGMLSNSRDKMFVSDAKKLISQAEYKVRSQNGVVEKPAEGNCVALSLVFLDNGDFTSTPNEGSYEKEASFVVVKNNGGDLEYSVNLIEKSKKGALRGVVLTRENNLNTRRSSSLVSNFDDLIEVESDDFTIDYINEKLGSNYCEDVETVYNKASYSGGDSASTTSSPIISKVSLTSTSKKNYNTRDATLSLTVTDDDTARNNLLIYLSTVSYGDARESSPNSYGDNETFLKEYDFDPSVVGNTVSLYIVVVDDTGNEVKKKLTYPIHANDPPSILSTSYISKRDQDRFNMPTAKLVLNVLDDNDSRDDLTICFSTDKDASGCSGYQSFNSVFGDSNVIDYAFSSNSCYLNGNVKFLKVFVRDSNGLESSQVFEYAIFNNQVPSISNVSIISQAESFTTTGSLRVRVNFDTSDDYSENSNLRIRLSDGVNTSDYSYQASGYDYVFSGGYDGNDRTLTITVFDECDKSVSIDKTYRVYSNGAPSITNLSVESKSNACSKIELCPLTKGGMYSADVSFDITDDSDADVMVCVSENSVDCSIDSNYKSYVEKYSGSFEYNFTKNCSKDYNCDNQDRVLYVYAKDSNNTISSVSKDYKIYKNEAPIFKNLSIVPLQDGSISSGSKVVRLIFTGEDDFTKNENIKYKISDGTNVSEGLLDQSGMIDLDYTFSGDYNGEEKTLEVTLTDGDGFETTNTNSYTLYNNTGPEIKKFNILSDDSSCVGTAICPSNFNNYMVNLDLEVEDDIDSFSNINNIKVCVSESLDGCDSDDSFRSYSDYKNTLVPFTFNVDSTTPYLGEEKTLYLKVKDSSNYITSNSYSYTIYNNVAPVVSSLYVYSPNNSIVNSKDYLVDADVSDDFGMINVKQKICYTIGDGNDEYCLTDDYVDFHRKTYSSFSDYQYDGTVYHFYVYYKDNYGLITKSSIVDYQIHNDEAPVIKSVDSVVSSSSSTISVGVSAHDALDTYQVGISEVSNGPYTYSGTFNGDDLLNNVVNYTPSWDIANYITSLGSTSNYNKIYVVVKDSSGKISSEKEVDVKLYSSCDVSDQNNAFYEYELDTSKLGNTVISAARCSGKCYYNAESSESNIKAYYKEKISYKDKFGTDYCLKTEKDYEANCSFKDCFYNNTNGNYVNKVIGTSEIISDYPWTFTLGSETYVCYSYYNLYTSSYNEGDSSITLTPTNTKICGAAIDKYGYKPDDLANSYLFADDFMYID